MGHFTDLFATLELGKRTYVAELTDARELMDTYRSAFEVLSQPTVCPVQ